MTAWITPTRHPVVSAVGALHAILDQTTDDLFWSASADELRSAMLDLDRLDARVTELRLRVAAAAERTEVGAASGATSTASWYAATSHQTRSAAHGLLRLAASLDGEHEPVRDALAAGVVNRDQAAVIVRSVDALPRDLDPAVVIEARQRLLILARSHDAGDLATLGRRILDVVAPEAGEAHEAAALAKEEREAEAATRLTMTDDGHGRTHGRFTLPTAQAQMLRKQLLALAAPGRQDPSARAERRPSAERLGLAFAEWIETYPAESLPTRGGISATAVVTMTHETLVGGLGSATLDTGATVSPGQARRLACEAGLVPAVLGTASVVLDLGRTARLHSPKQRLALGVIQGGCTAEGCDWPPGLCHAHHDIAWAQGGRTDIAHARLLCPHHHHRVHDPTYAATVVGDNQLRFSRMRC